MSSSTEISNTNIREMAVWILVLVFSVMFFVSDMGNILELWVYKKRQAGINCVMFHYQSMKWRAILAMKPLQ